jgi:hypothetical protein
VYNLSIVTTEPDDEDVYYYIEWGDGQVDAWVGPYKSGITTELTHQWNRKGTYTIKAKAKDINDVESDWGTLKVVMPTAFTFSFYELLQSLLMKFSDRFPLLQHIIQY